MKKYGVENTTQLEDIKEKMKQTCLRKYGVEYAMQNKEIHEKAIKTFEQKYGMNQCKYMRQFYNEITTLTKPHKKILSFLSELKIQYKIEYPIDKFFVDIYIKKYNLVIEVYGDYWHANPKKYKEDDILSFPGERTITAKQIWKENNDRINIIKELGFNVLIFWEFDINNNFNEITKQLCSILK